MAKTYATAERIAASSRYFQILTLLPRTSTLRTLPYGLKRGERNEPSGRTSGGAYCAKVEYKGEMLMVNVSCAWDWKEIRKSQRMIQRQRLKKHRNCKRISSGRQETFEYVLVLKILHWHSNLCIYNSQIALSHGNANKTSATPINQWPNAVPLYITMRSYGQWAKVD